MGEHSENHGEFLQRIAAAIHATELAAFSIEGDDKHLRLVCHVRPDRASGHQSDAAIEAFKDIVRVCMGQGKDGAIEIAENPRRGNPQFCIVILARRAGEIVGAAGFIRRCADLDAAKIVLRRVQSDATRFRSDPEEGD